jgi:Ca2+-binding EF-hand superfamily protein
MARQRSSRTRQLSAKTVDAVAAALGVEPGRSLTRAEAESLLTALVLSRLSANADQGTKLRDLDGWRRWAKLEAEAGFLLCDRDGSGTLEYEEFVQFVATSPEVFGPLAHIEQLFDVYDTNHNGFLDADEVLCLHTEVALEHEDAQGKRGPEYVLGVAKTRAEKMLKDYGKNGVLDFSSFAKCVYDDPQLMGTAANLRRSFKHFDTNGDDALDRDELAAMVS